MMAMYNGAMSQGVPSQAQVIQQPITSSQPLHIAGGHQVVAPRRLKILEHHVHRIDTSTKDNGQPEEELVVSNLRHFSIKVRAPPPPPVVVPPAARARVRASRARSAGAGPGCGATLNCTPHRARDRAGGPG